MSHVYPRVNSSLERAMRESVPAPAYGWWWSYHGKEREGNYTYLLIPEIRKLLF